MALQLPVLLTIYFLMSLFCILEILPILPYGEKSPELIRRYSSRITQHLVESGCKAIVVACNSASSNAIEAIVKAAGPNMPVIDMVTPVIRSISAEDGCQSVGLIGTRATIASGLYGETMNQLNSNITLVSRATPLLASAIEEGFFNDSIPGCSFRGILC